jgi:hypothetical protein
MTLLRLIQKKEKPPAAAAGGGFWNANLEEALHTRTPNAHNNSDWDSGKWQGASGKGQVGYAEVQDSPISLPSERRTTFLI